MAKSSSGQELLDLPIAVKILFTILGLTLVTIGLAAIINHLLDCDNCPKPADIEASFLIGIGLIILFGAYFPWLKLKFGDFEVERAVQEQAEDYDEEISRLEGIIKDYEAQLNQPGAPDALKQRFEKHQQEVSQDSKDKETIFQLLSKYPSYGFTTTRIRNFETGFDSRPDISLSKIRILANELVKEGKVRTRISRNGNMLYQLS